MLFARQNGAVQKLEDEQQMPVSMVRAWHGGPLRVCWSQGHLLRAVLGKWGPHSSVLEMGLCTELCSSVLGSEVGVVRRPAVFLFVLYQLWGAVGVTAQPI